MSKRERTLDRQMKSTLTFTPKDCLVEDELTSRVYSSPEEDPTVCPPATVKFKFPVNEIVDYGRLGGRLACFARD
jgi:hypothetical protein